VLLQVPSIETFMQQYHMQCPMAYTRLVKVGLPATIEHRKRWAAGAGAGAGAGLGSTLECMVAERYWEHGRESYRGQHE
jgi:hypothetical protein